MHRNYTGIGLKHHYSINRIFWRVNTSLFNTQSSTQTIMTCILKALLYQMLCKDFKGFQTWKKNSHEKNHMKKLSIPWWQIEPSAHQTTGTIQLSRTSPHENADPAGGHLTLSVWCWMLKEKCNQGQVCSDLSPASKQPEGCILSELKKARGTLEYVLQEIP